MAPAYAFDTTRKSGEIAAAIDGGCAPGCELVAPAGFVDLAEELIEATHDPSYVEASRR